jgi:ribosomal protein S12 methylthiotransferase accessory factor
MEIALGPADRVEARGQGRAIATDQDGSAPSPLELFFASIGTCAGFYVSRFCRQRGIPTAGIQIRQRLIRDPGTGLVGRVELEIGLPEGFPAAYRDAVLRAAGSCAVKKHLERPPVVGVAVAGPTPALRGA